MTPLQIQMHQQLKAKHAELFKKIVEQQEELRKISEQLLMTQYGLVPVSVAQLGPFGPTQVSSQAYQSNISSTTTTMGPSGPNSGMNMNSTGQVFGPLEMQFGYNSSSNATNHGNSLNSQNRR